MRAILVSLLTTLVLAGLVTPAWAADPMGVAILNLEGEGVDGKMADTLTSIVRNEALQIEKYQVVNKYPIQLSDVVLMLDCDAESPSCLKQVAQETKARLLIYGSVQKQNEQFKIELNVFDAETGRMLNRLVRSLTDTSDPVIGFRKEIEAFFAEQREGALTRLQIGASVEGAQIRIEETFVGVVPLERKGLPPGTYEIQVAHPDYEVWKTTVKLEAGGDESIWAQLVPLPAKPDPVAEPTEATETSETTELTTIQQPDASTSDSFDDGRGGSSWGAWSAIAVGGLTLGGSALFGVALESLETTLEEESAAGTLTEKRRKEAFERGENWELAHRVLLGVGAVTTAVGIVWLIIDKSSGERAALLLAPDSVSVRVQW